MRVYIFYAQEWPYLSYCNKQFRVYIKLTLYYIVKFVASLRYFLVYHEDCIYFANIYVSNVSNHNFFVNTHLSSQSCTLSTNKKCFKL